MQISFGAKRKFLCRKFTIPQPLGLKIVTSAATKDVFSRWVVASMCGPNTI
jgi:hypothetical protein